MDVILFSASILGTIVYNYNFSSSNRTGSSYCNTDHDDDKEYQKLQKALKDRTTLNATEKICIVNKDNTNEKPGIRADMRLYNLWHRATYILILHEPTTTNISQQNIEHINVIIQKRSLQKDYCPGKYDPLPGGVVGYNESYIDNAIRELYEEMGIRIDNDNNNNNNNNNTINRLFSFPYEDNHVRVWGDLYECHYHGSIDEIVIQKDEVDCIIKMSLAELKDRIENSPNDFMPDACYAMKLYLQRLGDIRVKRRLIKGYSSGNLDSYILRPKPKVIFFDCDDCLYFDGWKTADHITKKIDDWCTTKHNLKHGDAYELYKKYGTALRGLLAEGYIDNTQEAIDEFLQTVHDIPVHELIQPDQELRQMLLRIDPTIPKYIFTASVKEHAIRCLQALGIADLFVDIIDCKSCNLETKHTKHSFEIAMQIANVTDNPEECIFLDDNIKNISAAREIGWRSILVGKIGRDCKKPISTEHAELEIDKIHHIPDVLPELFTTAESM